MNRKALPLSALACALTAAGAAHAQSSVTMYGAMDAGLAHITGVGPNAASVNLVAAGPLITPRLGFKGSEDLGGGVKANFLLESELLPDTGTFAGVFFKRGAWVGLQSTLGEVRLGRQNTESYDYVARFDPLGGANVGGAINANATGAVAGTGNIYNVFAIDRVDNAVQLRLAPISGFAARATHAFGEVAGAASAGSLDSIGADYTGSQFEAAAYLYHQRSATAGVGLQNQGFGVFAAYKLGPVKLLGGHTENKGKLVGGAKFKDTFAGVKWSVTPAFTLSAQVSALSIEALDAHPKVYGASATYALSKRTQLYALAARSDQDKGSRALITSLSKIPASDPGVNGANQTGVALGIAHFF